MATPTTFRIGVVATRLGGTDGVSLEADAWSRVLHEFGHEVHVFTGLAERPIERCRVSPRAFFGHAEVATINASVFGTSEAGTDDVVAARRRLASMAQDLQAELERWIAGARLDLIIAENTLALPVHLPLGLALARTASKLDLPLLARHHDLPWERSRFAPNVVEDVLDEAFPPRLPNVHHTCINSRQCWELEQRLGRRTRVIPNVIEMDDEVASDGRADQLRQELGLADNELFVLQPTRVVPRKGIEHAIELVCRLARPAALVVSGASGDEGRAYGAHLEELARLLDVHVVWAAHIIAARRGPLTNGAVTFSLDDAFEAADLVTYPSLVEGFGRAVLAAARHRRPLVVNRYPVYDRDIRPLGFKAVEMEGFVSEATVAEVRAVLGDPALRAAWADHNAQLVRRHFSTDVLRRALQATLDEILVRAELGREHLRKLGSEAIAHGLM